MRCCTALRASAQKSVACAVLKSVVLGGLAVAAWSEVARAWPQITNPLSDPAFCRRIADKRANSNVIRTDQTTAKEGGNHGGDP